ncbi:hypothetical protein BJY01DRAFT_248322 [Aspergillus pseudoustus]|uniref:Uncharacterized protein n=1 Tax=Aspergillus pseudoustus TaxID=1810923 RepID=A0ABR4JYI2_9EURO
MNVWARWMAVARKRRRGGRESWGAKAFKKQSEEDGREGSRFWLPPQKASLGREREVWLNDERAPLTAATRGTIACGPRLKPDFPIERTVIYFDTIRIYGWPSRGGIIVLTDANRVDFDYLGWDILDPPLKRDRNQEAEDEVCKKLLLLGATWYDSKSRFKLLAAAADNSRSARAKFYDDEVPAATKTESLYVKVGWPSTGGLWVLEFSDWRFEEVVDDDVEWEGNEHGHESGLVVLAKDMDERCDILERLGGKFYAKLEDYDGSGCLKTWEKKTTGEAGPLVITSYVEW